ncbi:unnamed protein product [Rotaria sp. Silwood2]|nr:unnamed protein product [Rotaria sp. Silwood2]CAF3338095.1 unnamed protein product [Rotaria sp. Silwood2]
MQVLIKEPSDHSHASDPDRLHVIRLKNEIKLRGASSDEGASTISFDLLRTTPLTATPGLPTNDALLQIIHRGRLAIQLDHHGRLPLILLRQTDRDESFVLYEDDSMVIFTCDKNLSVLNQCKHWLMNGTLSICPKSYYQLFTVHRMYSFQIIPLVYVLLIGKDTNDYNNFFQQLLLKYDHEPEPILVDFESATLKSTKSFFPDAIQIVNFLYKILCQRKITFAINIGCLFHFGQCLWREMESLGLQNKYTDDDKFRMNVKKLMALAFVPVPDVLKAYSSMINDFNDENYSLVDYFKLVWVGKKKGKGLYHFRLMCLMYLIVYNANLGSQRSKPKYSLLLWIIYERVTQDLPRSNKAVEGWHHAFNSGVSIKHPSITKLAKCILREQSRFEIDIEKLRAGEQLKKEKESLCKF